MAELGTLQAKVEADTTGFSSSMSKALESMTGFSTASIVQFSLVGLAISLAIGAANELYSTFSASTQQLTTLDNVSKTIGITAGGFQKLAAAADESGVSSESLAKSMELMNANLGKLALSEPTVTDAFKQLGLTWDDLRSLSPDQQFTTIATHLKDLGNVALETDLARKIFGRGGIQDIALFNSNIAETQAKVEALGGTVTNSQTEAAHDFTNATKLMGVAWDEFKDNLSADIAPTFTTILTSITDLITSMGGLKVITQEIVDLTYTYLKYTAELPFTVIGAIGDSSIGSSVFNGISKTALSIESGANSVFDAITHVALKIESAGASILPSIGKNNPSIIMANLGNDTKEDSATSHVTTNLAKIAAQSQSTSDGLGLVASASKEAAGYIENVADVSKAINADKSIANALTAGSGKVISDVMKDRPDANIDGSKFKTDYTKLLEYIEDGGKATLEMFDTLKEDARLLQGKNFIQGAYLGNQTDASGAQVGQYAPGSISKDFNILGLNKAIESLESYAAQQLQANQKQSTVDINVTILPSPLFDTQVQKTVESVIQNSANGTLH